ncbi:MAG: T9SS type A sorting domain-containing protein [Bacteroidetes bacterium]|nr:T9SS type A sorting domain-containing protein [Bacteroidota bacterium]
MRNFSIILYLLLFTRLCHAQKFKGNVWCFGDSSGIDWSVPSNPATFISMNKGRSGTASLCDSANNLLLYSGYVFNGLTSQLRYNAYNRFHKLVENGDSIFGEDWYHSALFIPKPNNDSVALFFTNIVVNGIDPFGLYYSIINFKANSDSGIVTQKNIQLNNLPAFDGLAAVKHGNGRDWWVIFKDYDPTPPYSLSNKFYVYLVNENGPSLHHTQNIGALFYENGGHLFFNSEGSKMYICSWGGVIEYIDFDRCTGLFSNPTVIEPTRSAQPYPYYNSLALSPDETKLYVSAYSQYSSLGGTDSLYQFDLIAANISASKTHIYGAPNTYIGLGALRKAPDDNIYLAANYLNYYPYQDTSYNVYNTNLSVINQPDSLGLACDFQPFNFYLGGARTYNGLPNNPDYELGAWVGSPCDTLTVGLTENDEKNDVFFQAWYNPEWNMIHVNASKLKGKSGVLRLFDMEGRVVYERKVDVIAGGYFTTEIFMNDIASGVYIVSLSTEKDKVQGKIMKF